MKKLLFIAALFVSTGIISSCTKEKDVTPTITKVAEAESTDYVLGTGDGGVDRPTPPKKP